MKKSEQKELNIIVDNVYDDLMNTLDQHGMQYIGKLRTCNAEVYSTYGYYVLRSYNTIVACIDRDCNGYDFLRKVYGYTATSAQHIAKFFTDYGYRTKVYTWRYI